MSPTILKQLAVLGPEALLRLVNLCFQTGLFRVIRVRDRDVTVECGGKKKVVTV